MEVVNAPFELFVSNTDVQCLIYDVCSLHSWAKVQSLTLARACLYVYPDQSWQKEPPPPFPKRRKCEGRRKSVSIPPLQLCVHVYCRLWQLQWRLNNTKTRVGEENATSLRKTKVSTNRPPFRTKKKFTSGRVDVIFASFSKCKPKKKRKEKKKKKKHEPHTKYWTFYWLAVMYVSRCEKRELSYFCAQKCVLRSCSRRDLGLVSLSLSRRVTCVIDRRHFRNEDLIIHCHVCVHFKTAIFVYLSGLCFTLVKSWLTSRTIPIVQQQQQQQQQKKEIKKY